MSNKKKRLYKHGMELFHNETKAQILFGKWKDKELASCINKKTLQFIDISREELDTNYTSYSEVEKRAKERRKGQSW